MTARCFMHGEDGVGCYAGFGKWWRFIGAWSACGTFYALDVASAGGCQGDERRKGVARAQAPALRPTLAQRQKVIQAAEALLQKSMKPTPGAVKIRLGAEAPAMPIIKAILKARRSQHGKATREFAQSSVGFRDWLASKVLANLRLPHVGLEPFCWVAVLVPFVTQLVALRENGKLEAIHLCADFTFQTEYMGFLYGLVSCVVRRKLAGLGLNSICRTKGLGNIFMQVVQNLKIKTTLNT